MQPVMTNKRVFYSRGYGFPFFANKVTVTRLNMEQIHKNLYLKKQPLKGV